MTILSYRNTPNCQCGTRVRNARAHRAIDRDTVVGPTTKSIGTLPPPRRNAAVVVKRRSVACRPARTGRSAAAAECCKRWEDGVSTPMNWDCLQRVLECTFLRASTIASA